MTEELNRRHNLATMPTINNNGESYIVPFDIYKEGYDAYDISNWFKGRVGDNGTPFGIRWYKHGQLMDVTGMRPFIEGQVGDYTIDDSDPDDPKINMDSEASNVHVVGEVNDCQEYGVAIYRLINQAMPQSGIFYGKIGVMGTDIDGTTVMSSVDVVFKVLAGHMNMLGARKFYVSELEKAWLDLQAKIKKYQAEYKDATDKQAEQFKEDTEKALADLNTKIANEIKRAEDTLGDTQASIDANIASLKRIAATCGSIQAQIDANDIVKVKDFNKVIADTNNKIDDRLKHISLNPEAFASLNDLNAKYPHGSDGLFRIGDEGFIWENGTWSDIGKLASTVISDSDFNQRLGSFMFFDGPNDHVEITERYSKDLDAKVGTMTVPKDVLIYLADQGLFKSNDALNLKYTYTQHQVSQNGCMTLYFDNSSQLYFAFKPVRRNDLRLFSIYNGKIFGGINTNHVYVNGISNGGWGSDSIYGYAMLLPMFPDADGHISVDYQGDWKYKVTYPTLNIAGSNGKHEGINTSGTIEGQGGATIPLNLYASPENDTCYLDTRGHNSNDYLIGTLYGPYVYGQNVDAFVVNGIDKGGFGHKNKSVQIMAGVGDAPIKVSSKDWEYSVVVPSTINFIDAECNHWDYRGESQNLSFKGDHFTTVNLFYSQKRQEFYLDKTSHDSHDYHITTLYNNFSYGTNNKNIIVNGISNGGWGPDSIYSYVMLLPTYPDDGHIEVEYQGNWKYKVTYGSLNVIGANGKHDGITHGGTIEGQGGATIPLNLYVSHEDENCYLDTNGHNSNDYFIGTLYGPYVYGQNVDAFVVNGIDKGGFGKPYKPYTLTDWRIDAENGQESNIVWFGDSTFAGYKVENSKNIAANYINNYLVTNFPKTRSYNCSISGLTTWGLLNVFENKIADVPTPKLVLIGGGINDGGNVSQSREALKNFVRKVQGIGAVPVICTTQASNMLYARRSEGGDWDLEQNWYAKINEMRREFARSNNLPLLDLEKFDTDFIQYGPNKLDEMFDDQMHGHDSIHRFEAQLVMAYLSKDQLDFINHDQVVSLSTMKAKSTSEYSKTNQELDNPVLNVKGFKSHMVRSNVDSDLTIIDYQFFVPASDKTYYLNGYNLGAPVTVSLNGDLMDLTGTMQLAKLNPGYYHVTVQPRENSFDLAGLRVETDNLNATDPIQNLQNQITQLKNMRATEK